MTQIDFSFVMPSFKTKFMKEAVQSILTQSYTNFELIIVNDASPEAIYDLVSQFNDSRISYYENKTNIGSHDLVGNWNHCVTYAKGKYLILASDDDIYESDFLYSINKLIVQYPEVELFRSRVQRINSEGEVIGFDYMYPTLVSQVEFVYYWSKGLIKCISNYVFKRNTFLESGGFINFPCAWFSDDATVIKSASKGVLNTSDILFNFRSSDINISMRSEFPILKAKLAATDMFNVWITNFLNNKSQSTPKLFNSTFFIHNYIYDVLLHVLSDFRLSKIFYVLNYLINNKYLYKKEKIYILMNFLSKNLNR